MPFQEIEIIPAIPIVDPSNGFSSYRADSWGGTSGCSANFRKVTTSEHRSE